MPKIQLPSTTTRDARFEDLEPEVLLQVRPEDLALLRADLYPRFVATIEDGPEIKIGGKSVGTCGAALRDWAKRMAAKAGGDHVTVWKTPTDHLSALAVVIYGEAPIRPKPEGGWDRVWPESWTASDVERALAWESGANIPGAVSGRAVIAPLTRVTIEKATLT